MRLTGIRILLAATILGVLSTGPAFAAGSEAFCGTWLKLCNKTCPEGAGTCGGACAQRYKGCHTSGCFFFNVPGARCQGNATMRLLGLKSKTACRKVCHATRDAVLNRSRYGLCASGLWADARSLPALGRAPHAGSRQSHVAASVHPASRSARSSTRAHHIATGSPRLTVQYGKVKSTHCGACKRGPACHLPSAWVSGARLSVVHFMSATRIGAVPPWAQSG